MKTEFIFKRMEFRKTGNVRIHKKTDRRVFEGDTTQKQFDEWFVKKYGERAFCVIIDRRLIDDGETKENDIRITSARVQDACKENQSETRSN